MEIQRQVSRAKRITITYHPDLPTLSKIVRDHLPILHVHVSEKMRLVIPNPPLVANRSPWNLKEPLKKAMVKSPQCQQGGHGCGRARCKMYACVKMGTSFKSTVTKERFWARVNATCKISNVVYLIECARCYKQYLGETESSQHLQMNGHWSDYYLYRKLPDKTGRGPLQHCGPHIWELNCDEYRAIGFNSNLDWWPHMPLIWKLKIISFDVLKG